MADVPQQIANRLDFVFQFCYAIKQLAIKFFVLHIFHRSHPLIRGKLHHSLRGYNIWYTCQDVCRIYRPF
jgi:hypothetical protein